MSKAVSFVMGHVWLLVAVMLWLGRKEAAYAPGYTFFGAGGRHSPFAYQALIVLCLVIGLGLIFSARRASKGEKTD